MKQTRCLRLMTAVSMILFLSAGAADAHKVNIFAYAEDGMVYTESYFPDGRPVENAVIEVLDGDGKKILEGRTDGNGLFSFKIPEKKEDLTIVLNASLGHRNQYVLKKQELGG